MGQDPKNIDFTDTVKIFNQDKKDKYDWSKDKIDLETTTGGPS